MAHRGGPETAILRRQPGFGSIDGVEPTSLVHREEAVATMFLIADLNAKVGRILALLEGDEDGEEGQSENDA